MESISYIFIFTSFMSCKKKKNQNVDILTAYNTCKNAHLKNRFNQPLDNVVSNNFFLLL